jgi:hypothetical protein
MTDTSSELKLFGNNFGMRAADITVQIAGQNCTGLFLQTAHSVISCNSPRISYAGKVQIMVAINGQYLTAPSSVMVVLPQLQSSLRNIIFTVTAVVISLMMLLFVAVFRLRTIRVFKASSPLFLYIFISGSCMQVLH